MLKSSRTKSKDKKYQRVEGISQRTWDSMDFDDSPTSQKLLNHFKNKFVPSVALIGLVECLPFPSCKIDGPGISVARIGPPRSFKTVLLNEIKNIFSDDFYINLNSDFTLNSLERYIEPIKQGCVLVINDAALLLDSKPRRTKYRLEGGIAGLASDGIYEYQDFRKKFTLEGNVKLLFNITYESYIKNRNRFFASTLSERLLMLFHLVPETETELWIVKEQETQDMQFAPKITLEDIETKVKPIPLHFLKLIKLQAKEISYLTSRSYIGSQDLLKGLVRAHASLNHRDDFCSDDFALISMAKSYLIDPFNSNEGRIVKLRGEGFSYREIEKMIHKRNYLQQIQRVVEKAQIRGILPRETKLRLENEK